MKEIFGFLLLLTAAATAKAGKPEPEFNLNQNDYEVKFEQVELVRYNKNYVNISIVTYKFNRTQPVMNCSLTFTIDVNYGLTFTLQAYKFTSNEYRYFPMRFAANACKDINANAAGAGRLKGCGNFTGCPFLQGRKYHMCNFYPDPSKLPPLIRNGEYKFEVEIQFQSEELYVFALYATVFRSII